LRLRVFDFVNFQASRLCHSFVAPPRITTFGPLPPLPLHPRQPLLIFVQRITKLNQQQQQQQQQQHPFLTKPEARKSEKPTPDTK